MTELVAKFENSWGREHKLRVRNANTALEPEQIKASLEKLTSLTLFEKKGACLFNQVVTASFFEEVETDIFDKEAEETVQELVQEEIEPALDAVKIEKERESSVMTKSEKPSVEEEVIPVVVVEDDMIRPNMLRRVLALPAGVYPSDLTQDQAISLVMSVTPKGGRITDMAFDEESKPVRIELYVQLEEGSAVHCARSSSPPKDKKRRWHLLDRLKKRRRRGQVS